MAKGKISMRKIQEIIRLKWSCQLSDRQIAKSCGIARSTVGDYIQRAKAAGLSWPLPKEMNDSTLEALLFTRPVVATSKERPEPDWQQVHRELKRKGVTLQLIWQEYMASHVNAYSYSRFCERFGLYVKRLEPSMRQRHHAGEKCFVDYAGMTLAINDRLTGEVWQAQIFVAVLGASNYTYIEASKSQQLPDWIASHVNAFRFMGGVTEILVPDNLLSGVRSPHRYEPDINPTYQDMAEHYGVAVIPARVRKPKDKSKVEVGVQGIERRILAPLRDRTFFSLADANQTIRELLQAYNHRPFQKMEGSRYSHFQSIDKPALRPLPREAYEYAEWKKVRAGIDYHVAFEKHYYSVPYRYIKHVLDLRSTKHMVEIFHQGESIAVHPRAARAGYTTCTPHMPKCHQAYAEWTPERLMRWANQIGPATRKLIQGVIDSRAHPQQGYRASLGILRLEKNYGKERIEKAAERAVHFGALNYKSMESILKTGLDKQPLPDVSQESDLKEVHHEFIRGADYYH